MIEVPVHITAGAIFLGFLLANIKVIEVDGLSILYAKQRLIRLRHVPHLPGHPDCRSQ
ncbi:hypothetical protein VSK92_19005 [Bacillus swezeyi]|uniref:hypothetical protein n=1 Tax=Bacillus swezeyi TaxID=1925020 RepID=UPI0039C5E257